MTPAHDSTEPTNTVSAQRTHDAATEDKFWDAVDRTLGTPEAAAQLQEDTRAFDATLRDGLPTTGPFDWATLR
jgi:hypothetical protein